MSAGIRINMHVLEYIFLDMYIFWKINVSHYLCELENKFLLESRTYLYIFIH